MKLAWAVLILHLMHVNVVTEKEKCLFYVYADNLQYFRQWIGSLICLLYWLFQISASDQALNQLKWTVLTPKKQKLLIFCTGKSSSTYLVRASFHCACASVSVFNTDRRFKSLWKNVSVLGITLCMFQSRSTHRHAFHTLNYCRQIVTSRSQGFICV